MKNLYEKSEKKAFLPFFPKMAENRTLFHDTFVGITFQRMVRFLQFFFLNIFSHPGASHKHDFELYI